MKINYLQNVRARKGEEETIWNDWIVHFLPANENRSDGRHFSQAISPEDSPLALVVFTPRWPSQLSVVYIKISE